MGLLRVRPILRHWAEPGLALAGGGGLLPFSDGFNRADGAIGNGWTGATWTIASGKAVNTPTLGSELHTSANAASDPNGNEANATTGWDAGVGSIASIADPQTGTYAIEITSAGAGSRAERTLSATAHAWYRVSIWAKRATTSGNGQIQEWANTNWVGLIAAFVTDAYVNFPVVMRATTTAPTVRIYSSATATDTATFDNVSIKAITLASLFATRDFGVANVDVGAEATLTRGAAAGVVLNLDDAATPANFVIGYHDGAKVKLEKCVAGVYTTLISTTVTYSAGAVVRVVKSGASTYQLWYGGTQRGTDQTVSDAGIVDNTLHGMFSTYEGNSLDDFAIEAV